VHRSDDEAWHVLEGRLRFRFADFEVDVGPGTTVFVPAGVGATPASGEPRSSRLSLKPDADCYLSQLRFICR